MKNSRFCWRVELLRLSRVRVGYVYALRPWSDRAPFCLAFHKVHGFSLKPCIKTEFLGKVANYLSSLSTQWQIAYRNKLPANPAPNISGICQSRRWPAFCVANLIWRLSTPEDHRHNLLGRHSYTSASRLLISSRFWTTGLWVPRRRLCQQKARAGASRLRHSGDLGGDNQQVRSWVDLWQASAVTLLFSFFFCFAFLVLKTGCALGEVGHMTYQSPIVSPCCCRNSLQGQTHAPQR